MADVQKYFIAFDEAIRFDREGEKKVLSEKRERILRRLSDGIKRQRVEGQQIPSYEPFNQGSYAIGTGIKPIHGEFDLDVGLRFDLSKQDYPDPIRVKTWVHNALDGHTKKVELRHSCVRVSYQEQGESVYHVDLVIYASGAKNPDRKDYVAKGKASSPPEKRFWELSDQRGLSQLIADRHAEADREQFLRVIRTLKRWKDLRFSKDGTSAPRGIALMSAAYHWFAPSKQTDWRTSKSTYDDLEALRRLVTTTLSGFQSVRRDRQYVQRLRIQLPLAPHTDLCERMSDHQMDFFKQRLEALRDALHQAKTEADAGKACTALRKQFGDHFPTP